LPIEDPNYTKLGIPFENEICARLDAISLPERDIPRTAGYRVVNALLDFALSHVEETKIRGLEEWEVLALINFFEKKKFRSLDPDLFWREVRHFNETLSCKVGGLPRTERLELLLKILHARKQLLHSLS